MTTSQNRLKPLKRRTKASFANRPSQATEGSTLMSTAMASHNDGFEDVEEVAFTPSPAVPSLFTTPPPVKETHWTPSLTVQDETMQECLPLMAASDDKVDYNRHGVARLRRDAHVKFLHKQLGKLPAPFLVADASRPWFLYWSLNGLAILGEDVSQYRRQLVDTARSMQNPGGGFGGGHGQTSHLATTYAVILALCLVGGEEAYEVVDREGMWRWLSLLKQPDGGVEMARGGEVDVRGAYCLAVVASLLDLPLELAPGSPALQADPDMTLFTRLGDYVQRCQTFEGGISGKPDAEAHGAYAFCALGCLSILDAPHRIIPKYLDVPRLISWLSSRQNAPESGFSGRTNKLVDGCYSHWVGGCWPLIDGAINGTNDLMDEESIRGPGEENPEPSEWFSREGLIRYIMNCGQDQSARGGLRDKPSRPSDAYHTCYVLCGLTTTQYKWDLRYIDDHGRIMHEPQWKVSPRTGEDQIFDEEDRVGAVHPTYTVPVDKAFAMKAYFVTRKPGT